MMKKTNKFYLFRFGVRRIKSKIKTNQANKQVKRAITAKFPERFFSFLVIFVCVCLYNDRVLVRQIITFNIIVVLWWKSADK